MEVRVRKRYLAYLGRAAKKWGRKVLMPSFYKKSALLKGTDLSVP
jgi:hypothetical protein